MWWSELWHDVRYRLQALRRRRELDRDLDLEIEAHLEHEAEAHIRRGVPVHEARRRARLDFGGVEEIKGQSRDARGIAAVEALAVDVRESLRSLRSQSALTIAAMVILAVGIGASTATFVAIKTVLHDPLPYPDDERIVVIWTTSAAEPRGRLLPTVPEFAAWRNAADSFESIGTLGQVGSHLTDTPAYRTHASPEEITSEVWSADLFEVLRLTPVLGRVFTVAEEAPDAPAVALISESLWERRFSRRPDILGRTMGLDGVETEIIGILPTGISPMNPATDAWIPLKLEPERLEGSGRGWPAIARLKPGVLLEDAEIEASSIVQRLSASAAGQQLAAHVEPFRQSRYGGYAAVLYRFDVLASAVFVAACANVAALLLMRVARRRRALAMRSAMGAERWRLLRQLGIEVLLISAAGSIGAIAVSRVILQASSRVGPTPLPHVGATLLDAATLLFVGKAAILAIFLIAPLAGLAVLTVRPAHALGWRWTAHMRGLQRLRAGLVVVQVGVAMVLLVGAGLLASAIAHVSGKDLGGDPTGVLTFTIRYPPIEYRTVVGSSDGLPLLAVSPEPAESAESLRRHLQRAPGIASAAIATRVPFAGDYAPVDVVPHGSTRPPSRGVVRIVSPHFFETLEIRILAGRDFGPRDTDVAPWVAIVNEAMAQQLWGDTPALGRTVHVRHSPQDRPREVVGVVSNTRSQVSVAADMPAVYLPLAQQPDQAVSPRLAERLLMTFLVRSDAEPGTVLPAIIPMAAAVDPTRTPDTFSRLENLVARPLAGRRHLLTIVGFVALAVVVLAGAAVYGTLTEEMAERSREVGIRRAFGAGSRRLWQVVIGRLAWLIVPGIVAGLTAAVLLSSTLEPLLGGVEATTSPVYAIAAFVVMGAAIPLAWLPVRRAMRTPISASLESE